MQVAFGRGTSKTSGRIYTVSEINEAARATIETAFPRVRVEGEISGYKHYPSNHRYFSLKDDRAQLRCALFAGRARYLSIKLADGVRVICTGTLSIYTRDGQFQLIVESVELGGLGVLWQRLEELKKKLQEEGLFDPARKRPLPRLPQRVGVVTSPEGQAIHDILKILRKRAPQIAVRIYPVRVQGEGAAAEIAEGIRWMGASGGCDVLIAGRGGGSIEDLWAFNEEVVARAIAACPVPVISAVGHEKDVLLSDLVADARAPTPSGAAEMLARSKEEFEERIAHLRQQLLNRLGQAIATRRERLFRLKERPGFRRLAGEINQLLQRVESLRNRMERSLHERLQRNLNRFATLRLSLQRGSPAAILERRVEKVRSLSTLLPMLWNSSLDARRRRAESLRNLLQARLPLRSIAQHRVRVANCAGRIGIQTQTTLDRRRSRIASAESLLNALGPFKVLERGYSICFKEGGNIVIKDASSVKKYENITVRLHRGRIDAVVKSRETEAP
ncbi:MAG: exodeoxyribonuclease VII large subunit [Acidobacteriota bacterium]